MASHGTICILGRPCNDTQIDRLIPFFMAHGIEPILPFDIILATFLVPDITKPVTISLFCYLRYHG